MRGHRLFWRGGYTTVDAGTLQAFHAGLQTQFGFMPVGTLVSRVFGPDGAIAVALYEEALFILRRQQDIITIHAMIFGQVNLDALKAFVTAAFGLRQVTRAGGAVEHVSVVEDVAEL